MARIFKTPFGAQGDTEQVPEAPQGDGSVSLTQGFGYDYEREYEDPAAKDIRREVMNGLFYDVTEAIGDIQLSGIAKWSADAAPYPAGAVVWSNNNAWRSKVGNNSAAPTEGDSWTAVATADSVGNAYVPLTRTITAGTGLTGGGNLSANRTLSADFASEEQAKGLSIPNKVISPPNLGQAMNAHVLGMGQTWQNVTSSRSNNTTYTNSTGRAIQLSILVNWNEDTASVQLMVNGQSIAGAGTSPTSSQTNFNQILPNGATYRLNITGSTTVAWWELR